MSENNKTKKLQNLNHIISEAYIEGMASLERVKKEIPKHVYDELKESLSKSYKAGRKTINQVSKSPPRKS